MENQILQVKCIDWFDDHFYKITYINVAKIEVQDYFPSTTTKLSALAKPFLLSWYGDLGTREALMRKDEAADKGTRLHWAWYTFTTGGAVVYQNPRVPLYTDEELIEIRKKYKGNVVILTRQEEMYDMMKLQAFFNLLKPKVIASEQIVYDIDYREVGTIDNIFGIQEGLYPVSFKSPLMLDTGNYIVDLKSGKSIGEAYMQVSDYAKMAEKCGYGPIAGALIAHTQGRNKDGIEGLTVYHLDKPAIDQHYSDFRDLAKVWDRNFGTRKPIIR